MAQRKTRDEAADEPRPRGMARRALRRGLRGLALALLLLAAALWWSGAWRAPAVALAWRTAPAGADFPALAAHYAWLRRFDLTDPEAWAARAAPWTLRPEPDARGTLRVFGAPEGTLWTVFSFGEGAEAILIAHDGDRVILHRALF